jgi:hypothetical protein
MRHAEMDRKLQLPEAWRGSGAVPAGKWRLMHSLSDDEDTGAVKLGPEATVYRRENLNNRPRGSQTAPRPR